MKEKPIREGAKLQGANPCPHIFIGTIINIANSDNTFEREHML